MNFTIRRENDKYNGRIIWSQDQIDYIINEYTNGKTMKALGKEFGVQYYSIKRLLHTKNIKTEGYKHNYPRIENIFTDIDSREKAYWLGVMYADGSVEKKNNGFYLGMSDLDHIEKFKQFLGAKNHNIIIEHPDPNKNKLTRDYYILSVRDKQMHDDLIKWGCLPDKSHLSLHIPPIKKDYIWDFIRGYFDGDGGFYYAHNKKKTDRLVITFTGCKLLLQEIAEYTGITTSLEQNSASKITYCLRSNNRKQVLNIIKKMYKDTDDSIRLNRKYEIYQHYMGAITTIEPTNVGCE